MTIFELVIVTWLVLLTMWLMIVKRGPRGKQGEGIRQIGYREQIYGFQIRPASLELLDDAEYLRELIQRINSMQLQSGQRIDDGG